MVPSAVTEGGYTNKAAKRTDLRGLLLLLLRYPTIASGSRGVIETGRRQHYVIVVVSLPVNSDTTHYQ